MDGDEGDNSSNNNDNIEITIRRLQRKNTKSLRVKVLLAKGDFHIKNSYFVSLFISLPHKQVFSFFFLPLHIIVIILERLTQ